MIKFNIYVVLLLYMLCCVRLVLPTCFLYVLAEGDGDEAGEHETYADEGVSESIPYLTRWYVYYSHVLIVLLLYVLHSGFSFFTEVCVINK